MGLSTPVAGYYSGMVMPMRASASFFRPILPWVVGLLRRSLVVVGLLFGFLLAGSALAHAETKSPHPVPIHGIGQIRLLDLPGLPDPITSIKNTITSVTKTVTPVTKVVTTLTTDVTTTVVQTIKPVVQPAMGMTAPVLTSVVTPPPARSRPPATTQAATPVLAPITAAPVAQPVSTQPAAVPTTSSISVVPPQVLPVEHFVPPSSPDTELLPAPSPRVPLGDDDPIMDVTGGNSTCGSSTNGPMFGVSRPSFGLTTALLAGTGVRPGAGPPIWWFFDLRHHPS
jgi:hypothetical protein